MTCRDSPIWFYYFLPSPQRVPVFPKNYLLAIPSVIFHEHSWEPSFCLLWLSTPRPQIWNSCDPKGWIQAKVFQSLFLISFLLCTRSKLTLNLAEKSWWFKNLRDAQRKSPPWTAMWPLNDLLTLIPWFLVQSKHCQHITHILCAHLCC